jgi:fumarate reductase flavoprotein subunit
MKVPAPALAVTFDSERACKRGEAQCPFGRDFTGKPALRAPLYAARVTGALFHTQGGLEVDSSARVVHRSGQPFSNLFAGGGAARGISGHGAAGYMAGNGLLTATGLGRIAGESAGLWVAHNASAA